jgi:hypothetical protein
MTGTATEKAAEELSLPKVATDTCGLVRPLKLRKTCCAYWSWRADLDGARRADPGRRSNDDFGDGPFTGRGLDRDDARLARLEDGNLNLVLDRFDPESGSHLRGLGVGCAGRRVPQQEGDIAGTAPEQR